MVPAVDSADSAEVVDWMELDEAIDSAQAAIDQKHVGTGVLDPKRVQGDYTAVQLSDEVIVALETIKAMQTVESATATRILASKGKIDEHTQTTRLLIALNDKLPVDADGDVTVSDEVRDLVEQLRARSVELTVGDRLTKEQISALKSSISLHNNNLRDSISLELNSMQVDLQNTHSIEESARGLLQAWIRLMQTLVRNQRPNG